MKLTRFKDLDCWQQARTLTKEVYRATKNQRFAKDLGLAGQIQGTTTSSMANIAEGFERRSDKEFV
jgi:four helix bundle protein